MCIRDRCKH